MKYDYSKINFNELLKKISLNRFYELPEMVKELFTRVNDSNNSKVESVAGDIVDNTDPKNPIINAPQTQTAKKFIALITQTGTNPPTLTELQNTTGITTPITNITYNTVGVYDFTLEASLVNLWNSNKIVISVDSPIVPSHTYSKEFTVYNVTKGVSPIFTLRSIFYGGGGTVSFQTIDNKINKVKLEIEIFE